LEELMKELMIIDNCYMDNYWITNTTFGDNIKINYIMG